MSRAIVAPDQVRSFIGILRDVAGGLREHKSALNAEFSQLKEVWRDKKYTRFEQIYAETSTHLDRFTKDVDDCVRFLTRKAELIDRYLHHGY